MLSDAQVKRYHEDGCLVVEDVVPKALLAEVRTVIDEWVERSRTVKANDELHDLEDDHSAARPRVRRFKAPDLHHDVFRRMIGLPKVVEALGELWGVGVRYDKSKLNMKSEGGGAAVEWHQDWAFYPHTNDDLAAVGFMLDDMELSNGPLMILPGSHRGPVIDHHADGFFCGAIDVEAAGLDVSSAIPLTGPAGAITIHHVRVVHGSAPNLSNRPRRLLLHQYRAADAWPLTELPKWDAWTAALLSGEETFEPRVTPVPVRLPYPAALNQGSIYENQRTLGHRYFDQPAKRAAAT
ncbi:MAG: phytanoyl-CoA dioxygenase family protein [Ectothiorhodospiraceae bacterium]|nr:phytanoyl-CoA dioxygenase family protein [Ectothiorhodospiraceae bacterium]